MIYKYKVFFLNFELKYFNYLIVKNVEMKSKLLEKTVESLKEWTVQRAYDKFYPDSIKIEQAGYIYFCILS